MVYHVKAPGPSRIDNCLYRTTAVMGDEKDAREIIVTAAMVKAGLEECWAWEESENLPETLVVNLYRRLRVLEGHC